jgi:uncharacterized membrane protein YhaH (DUF805 family)/uncharacterized membrane protein YphA (DoxX/SURF4 family)
MSKHIVLIARIVFGAWMLANGVNHFLGTPLYPEPAGHEPLAVQLMAAFQHSRMFDVAMTIELITGALILVGAFLPAALAVVMPVSVCAAFWAVILDHQPVEAILGLAAVALNALLCLAYIDYYRDMLKARAVTVDETLGGGATYEDRYAYPGGRTSQKAYIPALVLVVLVAAFYHFLANPGLNRQWVITTLMFPGFVLMARRLHDMGQSAWLLLIPGVVDAAALGMHYADALKLHAGGPPAALMWAAAIVTAAFAVWGVVGKGQAESNRFGAAEPA